MSKLLKYTYFILCFLGLFTLRVNAYIDPSVMTYAIQAIAGVAIALGTLFSLYWRKILKFIRKLFGVRASKHLNNEADEIVYKNPISKDELTYKSIDDKTIKANKTRELIVGKMDKKEEDIKPSTFKDNLIVFIKDMIPGMLVILAITFMIGYYAPMEIYMNNMDEFWFNYKVLNKECLSLCVDLFIVLILFIIVSYLLNKKLYKFILGLMMSILLVLYVHGNFLAGNMPSMDGTTVNWMDYSRDIRLSIILTLVVIIIICVGYRCLDTKKFIYAYDFVCVLIMVMLFVSLIDITNKNNGKDPKDNQYYVTTVNENNYSTDENFIIVVVDSTSGDVFTDILNSNDVYKDAFKDFTYYPNTTGTYPYTDMAVPYILTGEWYLNEGNFTEFKKETTHNSKLLKMMEDNNFRLDVYEEETLRDIDMSRYSNVVKETFEVSDDELFKAEVLKLAMYKYSPYYLKPAFEFDVESFDNTRATGDEYTSFTYYNKYFFNELRNKGYSTTNEKVFKFIHLEGAHVPFDYDEYGNQLPDESGTYTQKVEATMVMLKEYLEKLKDTGVYDNSNIIILADHGYADGVGNDTDNQEIINRRSNPILLIKGNGESHDLQISESPITYEDLQDVYKNLFNGADSISAFDGLLDDNDVRRFMCYQIYHEDVMYEYKQYGYAADISTMESTGKVYWFDWAKYIHYR